MIPSSVRASWAGTISLLDGIPVHAAIAGAPSRSGPTVAHHARRPGYGGVVEAGEESSAAGGCSQSIVVPCYRDAANVENLVERLCAVLPPDGELVLVDDGSRDGTLAAVRQATSHVLAGQTLTAVRLVRNVGQHGAVIAGMRTASGRVIVTLDSDLQYPPDEIETLTAALRDDVSIVCGVREERRDPMVRRAITGLLGWWIFRQTGQRLADAGSMFRAYDRRAVDLILAYPERRPYLPMMAAWLGIPVAEVAVRHEPRGEQGSRYRLSTLLDLVFDLVTGYALSPLRFISAIALTGAAAGFVTTFGLVLYRLLQGTGPSGLISVVAGLFFLQAVVLALLTTLAETVGRMYLDTRGHPRYVIGEVLTHEGHS